MNEYTDIFNNRGDLYNEAARIQPFARETERQILIDFLQLENHHTVCDVPAGGGYLADGLCKYVDCPDQIICVEPSVTFAEGINAAFTTYIASMNSLPLSDSTVDRVGSLAGLHHHKDKAKFFREVCRILKKGGIFAVADVLEGTAVGEFLNGPVDHYSTTGHRGIFLEKGEFEKLLGVAGFDYFEEKHISYSWKFESEEKMTLYCKSLFGLVKANLQEVSSAIEHYFECEITDKGINLPWSLLYGVGKTNR